MAAFTITSDTMWDAAALGGRTGNDTYAIQNCRLTIDTDTRWCANSTQTKGNIAGITYVTPWGQNAEVYVDGSKVRIIPFNNSSGNVPALGATISQGAISATMLGVWTAFNVIPTAAGVAMPASGYIKVKNVTGGNFAAGALTGIGASATGADTVGWMEVVGVEASAYNIYFKGKFTVRGEWFEHSTLVTTGTASSTYQLPASQANTHYAGCWVETAPNSGEYDLWISIGTHTAAASVASDDIRGKVCWIDSQGLLRLGSDGTNLNGKLPVAGCKIRVPNINFTSVLSSALTVNTAPHTTLINRPEFTTTSCGILDFDKANISWYMNIAQAHSLTITNCTTHDSFTIIDLGTPYSISNFGVGITGVQVQVAYTTSMIGRGGTMTDCVFVRQQLAANANVMTHSVHYDSTYIRCKFFSIGRAATSGNAISISSTRNITFTDCVFGTGLILCSVWQDLTFNNSIWFDNLGGSTLFTNQLTTAAQFSNGDRLVVDGFSFGGLWLSAPYGSVFTIGADAHNVTIKNVGTQTAPLDCGGPQIDTATWTRSTTTATVTSANHGLSTNMSVYVRYCNDITAIVIGIKTAIIVTDPNTFTFVCLNAGITSGGTLSYYPMLANNYMIMNSGIGVEDITMQRCYFSHCRTGTFLSDNACLRVKWDNVWGEVWHPALQFWSEARPRGCKGGPSLAVQVAAYGTLWGDYWTAELPTTTSCSWTRSGTVCTVTCPNHKLTTGTNIHLLGFSDLTTLPNTGVQWQRVITAINPNTFTIVVVNAGATSGTIDFEVPSGFVWVTCNPPTDATLASGEINIDNIGTAIFDANGALFSNDPGNQVIWEMPDYILGHVSIPIQTPGVGSIGGSVNEWFFHDVTYQIDKNDGTGFSTWKNFKIPRTFTGTIGQFTVTCADTTGMLVGDYIVNQSGLGGETRIASVDSPTQLTLTVANTATLGGGLSWLSSLPGETNLDAQKGWKLKIKLLTIAPGTIKVPQCSFSTVSTDASRAYTYPLTGPVFQYPIITTGSINPERTFIVPEDTRTFVVPEQSRTFNAPSGGRHN